MTIEDVRKRFEIVRDALIGLECCLLAGSERVEIEKMNDSLILLYDRLSDYSDESKQLTIVNYEKSK